MRLTYLYDEYKHSLTHTMAKIIKSFRKSKVLNSWENTIISPKRSISVQSNCILSQGIIFLGSNIQSSTWAERQKCYCPMPPTSGTWASTTDIWCNKNTKL